MASYYNTVVLVGVVTRDPEMKYTKETAKPYTILRLGIDRKNDGDERIVPLTVEVSVWNHQAELCCQFLKKGSSVLVSGELELTRYNDKDGEEKSKLRVRATRVQFMDKNHKISDEQLAEASSIPDEG